MIIQIPIHAVGTGTTARRKVDGGIGQAFVVRLYVDGVPLHLNAFVVYILQRRAHVECAIADIHHAGRNMDRLQLRPVIKGKRGNFCDGGRNLIRAAQCAGCRNQHRLILVEEHSEAISTEMLVLRIHANCC